MQNVKELKKGDFLFHEGDRATHVYLIQSGKVSLFIERSKQNIECGSLTISQFAGIQALFGQNNHNTSAQATCHTKVVEMPISALKGQIESSSQLIKIIVGSLGNQLKSTFSSVKSLKLEKDASPCPPQTVPKVFGIINLLSKHYGKEVESDNSDENHILVHWHTFRDYGYRMFNEEPERIKCAIEICTKLKLCEMVYEIPEDQKHEEDAQEQLSKIIFKDLSPIEQFADYYQYYFYKSGMKKLLKVDKTCMKIVDALLDVAKETPTDRYGAKRMTFSQAVDHIKEKYKIQVTANHFSMLEQKGLFLKQKQTDSDGVLLEFDHVEFQSVFNHWFFLNEIDLWNENGFVDLSVAEDEAGALDDGCPGCKKKIEGEMNFCPHCGHNLKEAA